MTMKITMLLTKGGTMSGQGSRHHSSNQKRLLWDLQLSQPEAKINYGYFQPLVWRGKSLERKKTIDLHGIYRSHLRVSVWTTLALTLRVTSSSNIKHHKHATAVGIKLASTILLSWSTRKTYRSTMTTHKPQTKRKRQCNTLEGDSVDQKWSAFI